MKLRALFCTLIISLCTLFLNAQTKSELKIVRGEQDTVYTKSHIIIGVTTPNSSIRINGESVKQYKTGSFGKEVDLKEGENIITINVSPLNIEKVLNIFYNPTPKTNPNLAKEILTEQQRLKIYPINKIGETLEGAYFNYGNGKDRLGGAKINFIDKGIKLTLVGENNNLYKVQLSDNRYTYIPKTKVKITSSQSEKLDLTKVNNPALYLSSPALSSSWTLINAGKQDKITISLSDKKPYIVEHLVNPGKIIIDLFGVQNNSNWITQKSEFKAIDNVDIIGIDSDITRVIINLKNRSFWGYSVKYVGKSLQISVNHAPDKFSLKGMTIGVDAGHGGPTNSGAMSAAGHKEKDQNLAMAHILKSMLEKEGAKVVMSRTDDSSIDNSKRVTNFIKEDIDLLVSIHCNAGGNPLKTGGTSTYYKHIEHRELAKHILARILEIEGVNNFGLIGNFNFTLNSPTEFPSVLVEALFMSNLWDEEQITDPIFQELIMSKVVKGLKDYLKYCKKEEKK